MLHVVSCGEVVETRPQVHTAYRHWEMIEEKYLEKLTRRTGTSPAPDNDQPYSKNDRMHLHMRGKQRCLSLDWLVASRPCRDAWMPLRDSREASLQTFSEWPEWRLYNE